MTKTIHPLLLIVAHKTREGEGVLILGGLTHSYVKFWLIGGALI